MLDRIQFMLAEGFLAFRRNGWMTFAAITTVAVTLFLIGGLAYAHSQLRDYASKMTGMFEMRATVVDGTPVAQISRIASEIRGIQGVKSANWIPRDKAWQKFLQEHPENREYIEIENPFPDAFKVTLTDTKLADEVVGQIKGIKGIKADEVKYLNEVSDLITDVQAIVSWIGIVAGGILLLTSGLLIYNAIRLTVISRRLEIRIMQLVGASFLTVRVPFYIEGIVQGAIGGSISVFVIFACQRVIVWKMPDFFSEVSIPAFPWLKFFVTLPALGAAYGLLCSIVAVRTPLRYR